MTNTTEQSGNRIVLYSKAKPTREVDDKKRAGMAQL